MTILVVDDDRKILKYLRSALSKSGYTALVSDSAKEAMLILSNTSVDLIITDIAMPDMDGMEFCRTVRSQTQLGYIPIIFLTALSSVDDYATGLIAGADDYLTKPIHLKELLAKIQEYAM